MCSINDKKEMKNRFLLIFLVLFLCYSCEKKQEYQAPNEDLTTLVELALNLCDGNKERGFLKDKKSFYIQFYNFKNPLKREISFRKRIVDFGVEKYKGKNYECLITLIKYKKISPTKFYVCYKFEGSHIDRESFIEYKNNKWVSEKCISIMY